MAATPGPGRGSLLHEGAEPLLALLARPLPRDGAHGERPRPVGGEPPLIADERLRRSRGARPGAPQLVEDRGQARVERRLVGEHLVDEADVGGAPRVEALPGREEGPRGRLADLGEHERRDDGGDDAELRLGEAEDGAGRREDDVAHRAEAHPAAERGALDARDHRDRARVDGREHVGHGGRVALVVLHRQADAGAHPGHVGAGAERRAVAGQHDGAQRRRRLVRQRLEGTRAARRSARR